MKTSTFNRFSIRKLAIGLSGMLLIFSLTFALPSGTVFAAGRTHGTPQQDPTTLPPNTTPQPQIAGVTQDNSNLSQAFHNAQNLLHTLQGDLNQTGGAASTLQDLINQGHTRGLDVSALSQALTAAQNDLNTAQSSIATAASLLASHNGFDSNGNVTDPNAASQTVQSATQALQAAQTALNQAAQELRTSTNNWQTNIYGTNQNAGLQNTFHNEQARLSAVQAVLAKADSLATMVQNLLRQGRGNRSDNSSLAAAFSTFEARLRTAKNEIDQAAHLLSGNSGFDGRGYVNNRISASQTIGKANQDLNNANDTLRQATQDLGAAIRTWESAYHNYNNQHH